MFGKPCAYKNINSSEVIRNTNNNNSQKKSNDEIDKLIEIFKNSFSSYFACFK